MGELPYLTFFLYMIIAEVILVVVLLISLIVIREWNLYKAKRDYIEGRKIAGAILKYMKGKCSLEEVMPSCTRSQKLLLLKELDAFNQRFSGEEWNTVKENLIQKYLIQAAREKTSSRDWVKRAYAAQVLVLSPSIEDKEAFLKLVEDPVFLVRRLVVPAIVKLKIKEGLVKILEWMGKEKGYSHYFYRDMLLFAPMQEGYDWIEGLAGSSDNQKLQLACLEIYSGRMQALKSDFLNKSIQSENEDVRFAALKVYARNPQRESVEILLRFVNDPNESIRKEAMLGLEHFRSAQTLKALEIGLSDPAWLVRTQAAEALKKMGTLGLEILKKQNPDLNKNAFEAANFILQIEWA